MNSFGVRFRSSENPPPGGRTADVGAPLDLDGPTLGTEVPSLKNVMTVSIMFSCSSADNSRNSAIILARMAARSESLFLPTVDFLQKLPGKGIAWKASYI